MRISVSAHGKPGTRWLRCEMETVQILVGFSIMFMVSGMGALCWASAMAVFILFVLGKR